MHDPNMHTAISDINAQRTLETDELEWTFKPEYSTSPLSLCCDNTDNQATSFTAAQVEKNTVIITVTLALWFIRFACLSTNGSPPLATNILKQLYLCSHIFHKYCEEVAF